MSAIRVIFGTETYNCQDLADRTGEALEAAGLPVEVLDMADVELDELADWPVCLVITSTFGDGEPPSNAQALHAALMAGGPSLAHVRYAVCALGDRAYPRFCQCGKDFDRGLAALGAQALVPRVDCDTAFEGPWSAWLKRVLAAVQALDPALFSAAEASWADGSSAAAPDVSEGSWADGSWPASPPDESEGSGWSEDGSWPAAPAPAARPAARPAEVRTPPKEAERRPPAPPEGPRQSPYRYLEGDAELATQAFIRLEAPLPPLQKSSAAVGTRKHPFVATVLENYNLNGPGSDKETRHVAFSLKGSGLGYRVGDALGVMPNNCPDLVRRIVQGTALRGDEPVQVGDEVLPLRAALTYRLDCTTVDRKLIELAARVGHPQVAHQFGDLLDREEARRAWLADHHVIDLVEAAWMRTDAQALVKALKPLGPRLYSISSSPLAHPGEVHVTVDVVRYELHGRLRKGTSSSFIGERCGPGVRVPIFFQSSRFSLVEDDEAPIIMVGPGTGIAPFRAFLEERAARGASGYNWLFFGARHATSDFLYREQLAAWQASGVLTRFDTAFSRDQAEKIYVQDRMREHGADLFAWLEAGSVFYVCGDATHMARDVHETLIEVIAYHGGYDRPGAEAYLDQMQAEGRYLRDIY